MRLGFCRIFRDQPIKFVNMTAMAIGRRTRTDALAKLARLCATAIVYFPMVNRPVPVAVSQVPLGDAP
jgi:hypothetical protein